MDSKELDKLIRELEAMVYSNSTKSAWELIKTIGKSFKEVRYPIRSEREKAWNHFQSLVERVKEYQTQERQNRERIALQSERHKNEIIGCAEAAKPPSELAKVLCAPFLLIPDLIGSIVNSILPGPEIDETKQMLEHCSEQLREGWTIFKNSKNEMLGRDKNEAFQSLKSAEELINQAWERWREIKQEAYQARQAQREAKRAERERRDEEYQRKQDEWRNRMQEKIERLEEVVQHKEAFIDRLESQIDDLRDKSYDARSDSFRDKVDSWIEEKETIISETKDQIRDIESKISEIRNKL
jgi:hypothetical protein